MSDNNVVVLDCVTRLNLPPDRVLKAAQGELESVTVLGWDKDGKMYFASTQADGGDVLWLLEKAKKALLSTDEF